MIKQLINDVLLFFYWLLIEIRYPQKGEIEYQEMYEGRTEHE